MYTKKDTKSAVSVSLSNNSLDGGSYVVRVNRNKVKQNNIISDICENYPSLDPYTIEHAIGLVRDQILKYLEEGRAVDVMGLGTLYPAAKGTVPRVNPQVAHLPDLTLRFSPSKKALKAVSCARPLSFMVRKPEPEIVRIISLKNDAEEDVLYKGYPVRITGNKLKIAGDAGGVFFVPPDAEGQPNIDESAWIKAADSSYLMRNYPKTLEFSLPEEVQEGMSYFIAVRTAYSPSGRLRREAVVGFSSRITVVS